MINREQEITKLLDSIEERFDACCDKQVAELLKKVVFSEVSKKEQDKDKLEMLRSQIDQMIEKRFGSRKA